MKQAKQMMGRALVSALVLWWMATVAWSQSLTWLGTLGGWGSQAFGVSADGSVVVGYASTAAGYVRAFRWTVDGGMQDLGTLGGGYSWAYGVSADGSVVVGYASTAARYVRAFRWTVDGGMQDLGTLPGYDWSQAYGVSADGSVVVGVSGGRAFRWTVDGGMQDLGTLPGGNQSVAYGVSADGAVVVGRAEKAAWRWHAFRWTVEGGMQDLGTLGGSGSWAYGVSADGSVVVGWAANAAGYVRAFRWTVDGGMQDLGTLPGYNESLAYGVSADGSVVVGRAGNTAGYWHAFRWTASGGMEDLNITYACLLTDGSILSEAFAISPDGRYIVGWGYNAATGRYEAFLLDTGQGTPPPTLTLTPTAATQQVTCPHTLIATLTIGECRAPVPNVRVRFAVVEGANAGVSGECVTGSDGRCDFSYVGERVGRDRIVAVAEVAGQVVQAEATVEWVSTTPVLELTPQEATGCVGSSHTLIATLTIGECRAPVPNVRVRFAVVEGANAGVSGECVTGSDGRCDFSYVGERVGRDRIVAVAEVAGQVVQAEATVEWRRASLTWLGTLGGGWSWAYGVSADGAVVVGGLRRCMACAFRWTVDGGMQDLGTLGGDGSEAFGVSADGAVVVGEATNAAWYWRAFRWTVDGGMQDLGTLPGYDWSRAYGVSADGAVVVGESGGRAFRWTVDGGMQNLGTLPGYDWSRAYGVSADGAVVVGLAYNAAGYARAFRWTVDGGMQDLGTLGGYWSAAYGVSADGAVVVGGAHNAIRVLSRAFRWTVDGGCRTSARWAAIGARLMVFLPMAPWWSARLKMPHGDWVAFRWTASGGMEDLNITYACLLTDGSILWEARAISPDGRYIVGIGYNAATGRDEAFLLDTGALRREGDVNGDGCVDDTDLQMLLVAFGQSGSGLREDLNGDGVVDDSDLLVVLAHYGSGC
jgi:probable HAF family extracellular repeat protein